MIDKPLLLYPKQAQELLGIGATKFYEFTKLPDFPAARHSKGKRPVYLRFELEEWVKNIK